MDILDRFKGRAEALRVLNIVVMKDGARVAEANWDGEMRRNQYSVSKSFTSTAVGIAVREGLLDLSERVCDAFAEAMPEHPSEHLMALTVRDLLTMQMGQQEPLLMGEQRVRMTERDWLRFVLAQPFVCAPGTVFQYTNAAPYLAARLVQRRAGCNLVDYLYPRLFEPLGIWRPTWETDAEGNTFGASGLMLCVSDLVKFAQLYLQKGQWNGKQLVPESWVRDCSAHHADVSDKPDDYGYLFWRGPEDSFRADGMYGQLGIVLPRRNAVIAVNAECREQDVLLQHIYDTVVPAL